MFRKGGSAGEGITSGLAPRQGYNTNENNTVKQNDLSKMNLKDMNMQQIKDLADRMAFQAPPMQPDRSLDNFKIDFGLDLISRSCLLYTSPSPRDRTRSRMPSSA